MTDDELRARLQRVDPAPSDTALDPPSSPRARDLLERAMTDTITQTPVAPQPGRNRWPIIAAAAAGIAALSVGAVVLASGGGGPATHKPTPKSTLALQVPAPSGPTHPGMNSCIRFDVSILKDMTPAFAGTVTSVDAGTVTLNVDHWYTGGSADVVTLTQRGGGGEVALEGGVAFEQGKRYLVTAANGIVNGCGYTGEATPDLEAAFNQAFSG